MIESKLEMVFYFNEIQDLFEGPLTEVKPGFYTRTGPVKLLEIIVIICLLITLSLPVMLYYSSRSDTASKLFVGSILFLSITQWIAVIINIRKHC